MPIHDDFSFAVEAEAASESAFTNIGKLTITARFIQWVNGTATTINAQQYAALPPKGADGKNQKSIEYNFAVNLSEFKPALTFGYERKVTVGGADWNAIVKPSLEKALGKKRGADAAELLRAVNGQYVAVRDVPQVKSKGEKHYNTIQFAKVFASREEAYAEASGAGKSAPVVVAAANGTAAHAGIPPHLVAQAARIKADVSAGKSPAAVAADWGTDATMIAAVLAL